MKARKDEKVDHYKSFGYLTIAKSDASYLLFATCHPVICYLLSDTHRYLSLETHSIILVI